jgi:hypothetical protein
MWYEDEPSRSIAYVDSKQPAIAGHWHASRMTFLFGLRMIQTTKYGIKPNSVRQGLPCTQLAAMRPSNEMATSVFSRVDLPQAYPIPGIGQSTPAAYRHRPGEGQAESAGYARYVLYILKKMRAARSLRAGWLSLAMGGSQYLFMGCLSCSEGRLPRR